jgi:hypothetical protein
MVMLEQRSILVVAHSFFPMYPTAALASQASAPLCSGRGACLCRPSTGLQVGGESRGYGWYAVRGPTGEGEATPHPHGCRHRVDMASTEQLA